MTTYVDSTPLLDHPSALRKRAEEDGFLFFKQFLPRQDVLDLRAEMLGVVERYGWRQPDQGPLGGRIDLEALNQVPDEEMRSDIGVSHKAYQDTLSLERLNALPHHPKLVALYRELFESDVLVHPRHIARMVTGHRVMVPTPAHQDFPLIQGTPLTWTCWLPVGDCPRTMGSLSILRGSHRKGYIPIRIVEDGKWIAIQPCPEDTNWVSGDFEVGDILTFTSYTVHGALPNHDKGLIRLSLDIRYQSVKEPVEEKSLLPHVTAPWEDLYRGWADPSLQYYWQKQPLQMVPWNDSYMQPSRRIC